MDRQKKSPTDKFLTQFFSQVDPKFYYNKSFSGRDLRRTNTKYSLSKKKKFYQL